MSFKIQQFNAEFNAMITIQNLKTKYSELCSPPPGADDGWNRRRGYEFEKLLAGLLRADDLDPRTSYKAPGEQIDGSFFLDGTVFLIEAKWHTKEIPASTLYQFKGKVDGKLSGTIGVFLSMSGYSKDAVDALTLGKSLNLILFDKRDIDAIVVRDLGFRQVLKRKLRKAAEEGIVYFPTEADLVTSTELTSAEMERLGFDIEAGIIDPQQQPSSKSTHDLVILCEGNSDRELIARLARRILGEIGSTRTIKIVAALGKYSIPKIANAVHENIEPNARILIVIDSDGETNQSHRMLEHNITFHGWKAVIPDPGIETWLGLERRKLERLGPQIRTQKYLDAADALDIKDLRSRDKAFSDLYNAITET